MKLAQLRRVARLEYGESLPSDSRIDGEIPVFGSNGQVGTHNQANTLGPAIIVGRKGSHGAVNFSPTPAFAIDTTYYVDQSLASADLRWLYYVLLQANLGALSQDTGVPGLSREAAYATRIPWTSNENQRRIADFLDVETARIDSLVERKRRLIELLEEKRTATITQAVGRSSGGHPIRLKHAMQRLVDTEHKTVHFVEDGDYVVARTSDIRGGKLLVESARRTDSTGYAEWTRRGVPRPGDVLLTREAPAGEACVIPSGAEICMGQRGASRLSGV